MGKKKIETIVKEVMSDEVEITDNEPVIDLNNDNIVLQVEEIIPEVVNEVENEEPMFEDDTLLTSSVQINKEPKYKVGDRVKIAPEAKFVFGGSIPSTLIRNGAYIKKVQSNGYVVGATANGRSAGIIPEHYLSNYTTNIVDNAKPFDAYAAMTVENNVKIQSKPYTNSNVLDTVSKDRLFIVVEEYKDWAHLKSGGWILLNQLRRIF